MKRKNIFVSGSSKGIGFSIAKHLANRNNFKVIINGRNIKSLKKAAKSIKNCSYILGDVSNKNHLKKINNQINKIDILICNVGNGKSAKPGKERLEDWSKSFNDNFYSTINTINCFKKKLIKSKGIIICISSICGMEYIKGAPITYSVTKAALNAFVRYYSKIIGPKGVKINAIAPGNIFFKGSTWEKKLRKRKKIVKKTLKDEVSLQKFGSTTDITGIIDYLINSNSNFINGSIFVVDGGQIRSF